MIAVAFMLGLRHGFDADHLAAIDGLARFNATDRPSLAKRTGFWFSVGHGAIVMIVASSVCLLASTWAAPPWLEPFGAWVSISVLTLLGVANLAAAVQAPAGVKAVPVALRGGLFKRLLHAKGRWPIMGVGALFAVSFDTFSQAALMAVTGTALQGLPVVIALASAFVAGMITTDGINGLWVARLLRRTDYTGVSASRIMCAGLGCVSLGTALLGICNRVSPAFISWGEKHEAEFGWIIVSVTLASFLLALAFASDKARCRS